MTECRGGEVPHPPCIRDQRRTSGCLRPEPPRQARTRCMRSASLNPATSWARPPHRRPSPGWCGTDRRPGKTALPSPTNAAQTHNSMAHPLKTRRPNRRLPQRRRACSPGGQGVLVPPLAVAAESGCLSSALAVQTKTDTDLREAVGSRPQEETGLRSPGSQKPSRALGCDRD